jgi:uncharacterized damage-inducible protein DinB
MNGYTAKDVADSFRTVRKNTLVIAEEIPEDRYNFKPAADVRSVAELLTHIAVAYTFQYQVQAVERRSNMEGFDFPALMQRLAAEEKQSRTKDQILELLRASGDKWAGWVEGLSDDFLDERIHFPKGAVPPSKTRFEMILSVKEHEMHHRGQLMLIERMLTIVPHLTRQMQARMAASMAAQKS